MNTDNIEPFVSTNHRDTFYIEDKDVTVVKYKSGSEKIYFDRKSDIDNLPCRFRKVQYFNTPHKISGKIEEI